MKKIELKINKQLAQDAVDGARVVADKATDMAKEGAVKIAKQYDVAKHNIDVKRFKPVFEDDINSFDYHKPFIIRIVEYDKRMENDACRNAIGFEESIKNDDVLTLYSEYANKSGITFLPNVEETIFCKNPYREDMYICLDDYFNYLRKAKTDELEMIAHSLGAKHVKITFKEEKARLTSNAVKADAKIVKQKGKMERSYSSSEYSNLEVASDVKFGGKVEPTEPELMYFKNESDIIALIKMRIQHDDNKIKSKTYTFKCANKREMQESTATHIDALLKKIGCAGNTSVVSQVQANFRTVLEYEISF